MGLRKDVEALLIAAQWPELLETLVKHLGGQHDQQSHAGGSLAGRKISANTLGDPAAPEQVAKLQGWAKRHPPKAFDNLREIIVHETDQDFDTTMRFLHPRNTPKEYISAIGGAFTKGEIHLRERSSQQTFDHEVGHLVYKNSKTSQTWSDRYHNDSRFDRHTEYSRVHFEEGFADTYMAYISSGGKASAPEFKASFAAIKTIIEGL